MLSCLRPNTHVSQPQLTVRPSSQASRSSIGSNQQHITFQFWPDSCWPIIGKAEIGLHGSPSQETPETYPEASFRPHENTTQLATQAAHPKCGPNRHKSPWGRIPLWDNQPSHSSSHAVGIANPHSQPGSQFYPQTCKSDHGIFTAEDTHNIPRTYAQKIRNMLPFGPHRTYTTYGHPAKAWRHKRCT